MVYILLNGIGMLFDQTYEFIFYSKKQYQLQKKIIIILLFIGSYNGDTKLRIRFNNYI